jgi:cytochrome c biogenesis protein CcmG, thiol:disulfide interchange protein DsbE
MRIALVALAVAVALGGGATSRAEVGGPPPWLGVSIEPGQHGVRVTEVVPGTPAEYVGLLPGDEISRVASNRIATPDQLIAVVGRHAVGDTVDLTVRRAGKSLALRATLAARLSPEELIAARLLARPAPGFALPLAAGSGRGALADLAGKVVVVEFLASWCEPCKTTYRELDQLDAERDVVVLGIGSEEPSRLAALARREGFGFAVLHDAGDAVRQAYFAGGASPTLIVIDGRGVVRFAGIGAGVTLDHALFAARAAARELAR